MASKKDFKKILRCTTECKRTGNAVDVDDGNGSTKKCPLFRWKVSVHEVDKPVRGSRRIDPCWVDHIEFHLHPTFNDPVRSLSKGPFEVSEEGYGSFQMKLVVFFPDPEIAPFTFYHTLNLEKPRYDEHHTVTFADVSDNMLTLLNRDVVSTPSSMPSVRKRSRDDFDREDREIDLLYGFDVDELTEKLYSLDNKDVVRAVDLVKRYRTKFSYIEENEGEFHFDLYTLTPDAVQALWDLTCSFDRH